MALEIHDFTRKMKGFVGRIKRGGVLKQLPSGIPFAFLRIRLFYDFFTGVLSGQLSVRVSPGQLQGGEQDSLL